MQQNHEPTPAEVWVDRAAIMAAHDRSSDTITRWIRTGKMPAPERAPTKQAQQWRLSTLRAHGVL